ncbi:ABC transporter ATP-binding protein [Streptomyces sp. NPDC000410]|uniref:ABC transporter ATP-binding protein n=1 Tax=Streptomyces sp. NPDC000410 TaxID=3154254 RepID=UPI003331A8E9
MTDLVVRYGHATALDGVSLTVAPGEAVAVVGPNGAGKSTLLRTVSGLVRPSTGSVSLSGRVITGQRPHRIARAGFAHVPEGRAILGPLTVEENLQVGGHHRRRYEVREGMERMMELFPALRPHLRSTAGLLSGGEQQMLAIARGLMAEPQVLALDEPSMGLAPVVVESVVACLRAVARSGTALLLAEQNARLALELADRAYVIVGGRFVRSGPAPLLDDEIIDLYMT